MLTHPSNSSSFLGQIRPGPSSCRAGHLAGVFFVTPRRVLVRAATRMRKATGASLGRALGHDSTARRRGGIPNTLTSSGSGLKQSAFVVGLVRPRARKSIHGAFMSTESSHRARRHRRDVCSSQAAAACFALGVAAANVVPTQPAWNAADAIGQGFPFGGGPSTPVVPHSAETTPGGGYKNEGY